MSTIVARGRPDTGVHPSEIVSNVVYDVPPDQPFGPKWKSQRPPGLPMHVRLASGRGAALPYIEGIAAPLFLGRIFIATLKHLAQTESGARFGLPANRFDARPQADRPPGKPLITAWGAFQFNRDAWRSLPGIAPTAFPWDSTPHEELMRPIARYARLFFDVLIAGGVDLDAARAVRLWHRSPKAYRQYLANGRAQGFSSAWQLVDARHRTAVDLHLSNAGIATSPNDKRPAAAWP